MKNEWRVDSFDSHVPVELMTPQSNRAEAPPVPERCFFLRDGQPLNQAPQAAQPALLRRGEAGAPRPRRAGEEPRQASSKPFKNSDGRR